MPSYRLPLYAGLLIAVIMAACASEPAPETETASLNELHRESARKMLEAEERQRKAQRDLIVLIKEPLASFEKEKAKACNSKNLKLAVDRSLQVGAGMDANWGTESLREIGAAVLDVGDTARRARCTKVARGIYDYVIEKFAGTGYTALRQRAEVGINDLRGIRS